MTGFLGLWQTGIAMESRCPLCRRAHDPGLSRVWALCPDCSGRFAALAKAALPLGGLARFSEPVLLVDEAARLLACNRPAEAAFGASQASLLGLAPGELLNCDHARSAGCGSAPDCHSCGLRQAIFYTQRQDRDCERLPVMLPVSRGGEAQMRCLSVSTRRLSAGVRLQLEDDGFLPLH